MEKKLTEEDLKDFDERFEEKVSLNGREIRLPYDADDSVRSVVHALQEKKKDGETVEEHNERKKEEILEFIRRMDTKTLQQVWDARDHRSI